MPLPRLIPCLDVADGRVVKGVRFEGLRDVGDPVDLIRLVRPGVRPGLGIEINVEEVRKHPFQQEILERTFLADGSVADW